MQAVLSPLVNVYQTQLDTSRRFADAIFSGTEKIDRLVLDAIHRIFNQQLSFAQAITSSRDPQSAVSTLQSKFPHGSEETVNYQKEVMRVFAEMQSDITESLQDYLKRLGEAAAAGALPGTTTRQANDAIYNPMTSMFSVWESAFKDAAALARKNMAETRSAMEHATHATADATRRTAETTRTTAESAGRTAAESAASAAQVPVNVMEKTAGPSNLAGPSSARSAIAIEGEGGEGGERKEVPVKRSK